MKEITERTEFDMDIRINEISNEVKNSSELQKLIKELDITHPQSIMSFGQEAAMEISTFSDEILSSISKSTTEDSGTMLQQLNHIMSKFDSNDFLEKKQNFLNKFYHRVKNDINHLLSKYQTMDKEISKIYIEIKKFENEINQTNKILDDLFEKNLIYYENLEKYIQAGFMLIDQLKNHSIPQLKEKASLGNQMDKINLQNAQQALEMMQSRVYDLELTKMVSIQTGPQIKLIQRGNYNLLRKISSAFVVTIPVFKSGLIQAITIRRQKIQADAMGALDDKTNEMLLKNAQNIASQSVEIAKLMSGTSIKIETLEKTFETIIKGIEETKEIEMENKQKREDGKIRLLELKKPLIKLQNSTNHKNT